mgnify:CR=1 FL=1
MTAEVEKPPAVKRYNLALPEPLYTELQQIADKRHEPVVDLLRDFIRLGILAAQLQETPGAALIIRKDGVDREVMII